MAARKTGLTGLPLWGAYLTLGLSCCPPKPTPLVAWRPPFPRAASGQCLSTGGNATRSAPGSSGRSVTAHFWPWAPSQPGPTFLTLPCSVACFHASSLPCPAPSSLVLRVRAASQADGWGGGCCQLSPAPSSFYSCPGISPNKPLHV